MEKNSSRKMLLFPMALFLATTFPKIVKKLNFLLNFHQKFQRFLKIPQQFVFRPNARKINTGFVKFFCKMSLNFIFALFFRKFLQIFENSLAFGGLRPQDPHKADPLKCSPNRNPGYAPGRLPW